MPVLHAEVRKSLFDPTARLRLARRRHYIPRAFRLNMKSHCDHNDMWLLRLYNSLLLSCFPSRADCRRILQIRSGRPLCENVSPVI